MNENNFPGGVWPVMLTPFKNDGSVDEKALIELVDWYIKNGASGLFACCQSSEIFKLSFEERVLITKITVEAAKGRVPVVASGHTSDTIEEQAKDIDAIWNTGVDVVILLTNRLACEHESDDIWLSNLEKLVTMIKPEIRLGVYECPKPYKRLLTPKVIKSIADSGRFYFLKDTCCDQKMIEERLEIIKGSNLKLYNANATTCLSSLRSGAAGYSGVMANFHPELYSWLCDNINNDNADYVQNILMLASLIERQYYPTNAKYHLKEIEKLPMDTVCRVQDNSLLTTTWKTEIEMMDNLCDNVYIQYCK
ncbi:MAG: dihydrodipicolinate synthase family protein [Lachnospirales bacterium]